VYDYHITSVLEKGHVSLNDRILVHYIKNKSMLTFIKILELSCV